MQALTEIYTQRKITRKNTSLKLKDPKEVPPICLFTKKRIEPIQKIIEKRKNKCFHKLKLVCEKLKSAFGEVNIKDFL